ARLAVVGESDDPASQAVTGRLRVRIGAGAEAPRLPPARVVLDGRGVQRRAAPAGRDERVLLGRRPRAAARTPGAGRRRLERGPPETHQNRDRTVGFLRQGQRHGDVDFDLRAGRVVHDAHDVPPDGRLAAGLDLPRLADLPPNFGDVLGYPAVDLAFQ